LQCFKPVEIHEDDPLHLQDIRQFVEARLQPCMRDTDELDRAVELFMQRCGGRFRYVALVVDDLLKRNQPQVDLEELENELPEGLSSSYRVFFTRILCKDQQFYDGFTVLLIRLVVVAMAPLAVQQASVADISFERECNQLEAMFPVRPYNEAECFISFHKSVVDWQRTEDTSGSYDKVKRESHAVSFYVDPAAAHHLYAERLGEQIGSRWTKEETRRVCRC
jgi:hypothetical protein